MDRFRYSSTTQHKAQHEQVVKALLRLMEGMNANLGGETQELVVDWLLNHIRYFDRALGMFLKLKMERIFMVQLTVSVLSHLSVYS